MRFSARYGSFAAWRRARPRTSAYARKIIQAHKASPKATLGRLRGISGLASRAWAGLSPAERAERNLSLEALRRLRQGSPLSEVAQAVGLSPERLKQHLGRAIYRRGSRWAARSSNRIQRSMRIYSGGKIKVITVTNSKDASKMAEHLNTVRYYLETGDQSRLKKFRNVTIRDAKGTRYKLETDPKALRDIEEMREEPEFQPLYDE